jgi:hypothetical protein
MGLICSYLHYDSSDTHFSYHTRRIWFDEFSALHHGDVVIVRTFVLCVMSCKSRDYVGTIQKTILSIYHIYLPNYKKVCPF